jgi:Tol biopolymer transport system component
MKNIVVATLMALALYACGTDPRDATQKPDDNLESSASSNNESVTAADFPIVIAGEVEGRAELFGLTPTDSTRHQLTSQDRYLGFPVWAPTGEQIAFVAMTEETADLMLLDAVTGDTSVLLAGYNELADWSPDGRRLLVGLEDGLHFLDVTTGETERVETGSTADAYGRWARRGDLIAYESSRDGNPEIYVTHLDTGATARLTENTHLDEWPSPSPDGTQIAWASGTEAEKNLWIMGSDGSEKRQVTEGMLFGDAFPEWSPDGTQILLTVNRDDIFVLELIDLETGETTHLGEGAAPTWR